MINRRTASALGWVCVAGMALGADPSGSAVATVAGEPVRLVVSAACFGEGREEAAPLGAKLLGRQVMAELGRQVDVRLGRTTEEVQAALAGGVEFVMLTADDWVLSERTGATMEAVMQSRAADGGGASWVLLAREQLMDSAVSRGHVLVAGGGDGELPAVWLEGWRRKQGLVIDPPPPTHRVTREPKASLGLLRTFFGKADACVVPEAVFVEACGQNPEVGQRLRRLAISPPLPGAVVAVAGKHTHPDAPVLRRAAERLASSPHGVALASLLGVRGFAPFSSARWSEVAALMEARPAAGAAKPSAVAVTPLPGPHRISPP